MPGAHVAMNLMLIPFDSLCRNITKTEFSPANVAAKRKPENND